jgi:hypothetical protein
MLISFMTYSNLCLIFCNNRKKYSNWIVDVYCFFSSTLPFALVGLI